MHNLQGDQTKRIRGRRYGEEKHIKTFQNFINSDMLIDRLNIIAIPLLFFIILLLANLAFICRKYLHFEIQYI